MVIRLSFIDNASYNFTHVVNNNTYRIHVRYDTYSDTYFLNFDKYEKGEYVNIINNIVLTTGMNLLEQFTYYHLGSMYLIPYGDYALNSYPSNKNIVTNYSLLWEHD